MVLEKYSNIAGFNLEGYYFRSYGGLNLSEFIPTMETFEELYIKENYLGVCFIVDNIEKLIWIYQDATKKAKKHVKTIKSEKKESKLEAMTKKIFAEELNYDIEGYNVKRALDFEGIFMQLFKYQINEYPLYTAHYPLPQYEGQVEIKEPKEEDKPELETSIKNCVNCGWVISINTDICPKCRRNAREKFEGKPE